MTPEDEEIAQIEVRQKANEEMADRIMREDYAREQEAKADKEANAAEADENESKFEFIITEVPEEDSETAEVDCEYSVSMAPINMNVVVGHESEINESIPPTPFSMVMGRIEGDFDELLEQEQDEDEFEGIQLHYRNDQFKQLKTVCETFDFTGANEETMRQNL